MPWAYLPVDFDGQALTGGNLIVRFLFANSPTDARPMDVVTAKVPTRGESDIYATPKATTWELRCELLNIANQSHLDDAYKIFDENRGLVYLRCTDGTGATWRVACRVKGIRLAAPNVFFVALNVPNPIFEEDGEQQDQKLNQSASPVAIAPTANGNRETRPTFAITPDLTKQNSVDDFLNSLRGFIVNQAPRALVNFPVYLMDQSGAALRINTSALVKVAAGATTLNGAHTAGQNTLNLVSAAGFPNSGMVYIQNGANSEQCYYTGKAANQLTGVVRGIGGTVGFAHAGGQTTNVSECLANGDDVTVWLNDQRVERWLVPAAGTTWDASTASDIVININLPPRVRLTLTKTMAAGDTTAEFIEGVSELPDRGFVACQDEVIYYAAKTARGITGCVRGVWGTTAVQHLTSAFVHGNPVRYVCACGYALARSPASPASKRPCIQLPASANGVYRWGDGTDDPNTVYYDPANPDRSLMWRPGFDRDGNDISPLIRLDKSDTLLRFKDDAPGDGTPPYNFVEIDIPCGIRSSLNSAVINDWTPSAEVLNLELFIKDAGGTYKLIDQLQQAAAATGRLLPSPLFAVGYGVKLKARYSVLTGHRGDGSEVDITNTANYGNGTVAQRFVLERPLLMKSLTLMLRRGAGNQLCSVRIVTDSNGVPPTSPGLVDQFFFAEQTITSAVAALTTFTPEKPILIPAGTYNLVVYRGSPQTNQLFWTYRASSRRYRANCIASQLAAGVWASFVAGPDVADMYFLLNGTYQVDNSAPINSDQPVAKTNTSARSAIVASFGKSIMIVPPDTYPFVHRVSGFTNGLYHCSAVIANATTGDQFTIDKWMALASLLTIDSDAHTVIHTEQNVDYSVPRALAPADPVEWMRLAVGANALSYTEGSIRQTDIITSWRGRKV